MIQCSMNKNKPVHKPCHVAAQLKLVKAHLDKKKFFFKTSIIWSNETKIESFGHNGVKMIRCKKIENFLTTSTVQTEFFIDVLKLFLIKRY